jgi:glutaredoxin
MPSQVLMYSRPRCHLCDEARAVLLAVRVRVPFTFEEIDVDSREDLVREYGLRIPVVVVDGEELFEYRVEADAFEAAVRAG